MRYSSTIISLILTALIVSHTAGQTPDNPGLPTSADAGLPPTPAQRMEALIAGSKALQEKAAGLRKSLASLAQADPKKSTQEAEMAEAPASSITGKAPAIARRRGSSQAPCPMIRTLPYHTTTTPHQ